jgi:hypothetical protein
MKHSTYEKKRINMKRFLRLYKMIHFLFHIFIYIGFGILVFHAIISELTNFSKDTFGLTNYGFAILLGISSICFSWARNLSADKEKEKKRLMDNATEALYGALIFLLASGFKFVSFVRDNAYLQSLESLNPKILYIPKGLAFLCFIVAGIRFYNVIFDILKILFINEEQDLDSEIKISK